MNTETTIPVGATYKAAEDRTYLRDVSLETVDHVRALKLELFLDKKAKITETTANFQIAVLIYLLHVANDEDAVAEAVATGKALEEARKFRRNPAALWALPEVIPVISKVKAILSRNHFLEAVETMRDENSADEADGTTDQTAV